MPSLLTSYVFVKNINKIINIIHAIAKKRIRTVFIVSPLHGFDIQGALFVYNLSADKFRPLSM